MTSSSPSRVKAELAARAPYVDWIRTETNYVRDPFDDLQDERFDSERDGDGCSATPPRSVG